VIFLLTHIIWLEKSTRGDELVAPSIFTQLSITANFRCLHVIIHVQGE
jgi:hypothetical protein